MTNDAFVAALFEALLLPPGLSISLLALAFVIPDQNIDQILILLGSLTLYIFSIPATTSWLRSKLEVFPPVALEELKAEAIVVLGADRYIEAPEYDGDTLNGFGLERLRYAAWLQRRTGLPILVSGGAVLGESKSEAELMYDLLTKEFGADVRWQEGGSKTTYENALFSSRILKAEGLDEVLLVTHAWAMPRAHEAFAKTGVKVTAAPTGFLSNNSFNTGVLAFLPSASAIFRTHLALHELTGRLWYRLRYF
jgi:uncharacterized SAM-binding protein YcdF (DUF218 family)